MAQKIFLIIIYTFMAGLCQIDGVRKRGKKISDWFTPSYELNGKDICFRLKMDPKVLVLIASAPHKADQRNAIRHTWGSFGHTRDIAIGFVLGQANKSIAKNVSREAKLHDDLIVGNFVDSYYNMTLKTLTMLDWVDKFCPMAKFLLKIDDDMFLNPLILLEFTQSNLHASRSIFGKIVLYAKPNRSMENKHYISAAEYPFSIIPSYASGHVYLITADCIWRLKNTAMESKYMRLEDVFITGVIASKISVKRRYTKDFCFLQAPTYFCAPLHSIAVHKATPKLMHTYWRRVMDDNIISFCVNEYEKSFPHIC